MERLSLSLPQSRLLAANDYGTLVQRIKQFSGQIPEQVQGLSDCVAVLLAGMNQGLLVHFEGDTNQQNGFTITVNQLRGNRNPSAAKTFHYDFIDFWNALESSDGKVTISTSGTTGTPKSLCFDFQTLASHAIQSTKHSTDRWALAYNPFSFAGLQVIFQGLANQNSILALNQLDPNSARTLIGEHGITHISGTPTFYRMLLQKDRRFQEIRQVTVGGEPLDQGLYVRLRSSFPNANFTNIYASTELGQILRSSSDVFCLPEKAGDRIKILDHQLLVKPTNRSLHLACDTEGFFATGDRVKIVQPSPLQFRILGRMDSVVNVAGNKVEVSLVESMLEQLPEIESALVYGKKSSVCGELVMAKIVMAAGVKFQPAKIREHLSKELLPFQIPRNIEVVSREELLNNAKKSRLQ